MPTDPTFDDLANAIVARYNAIYGTGPGDLLGVGRDRPNTVPPFDDVPEYIRKARAEAEAMYPPHVMEAGGPDHYAAGRGQALYDAILAADWDTVREIAADPYTAGGDVDAAKEALAAQATQRADDGRNHPEPLGEAARLMRERAAAATPSPWKATDNNCIEAPCGFRGRVAASVGAYESGWPSVADAQHIASWHPTVALAVADWLDTGANPYSCVDREPMFRVARAYLGSQPLVSRFAPPGPWLPAPSDKEPTP